MQSCDLFPRAVAGRGASQCPRRPNSPSRWCASGTTKSRTTKTAARDLTAEAFLTRALKAPTLRDSVARLANRAREQSWSHEEFLIACLQREVAAREEHGGEGRIRAARFAAGKSLEEFDLRLDGKWTVGNAFGVPADLVSTGRLDPKLGVACT